MTSWNETEVDRESATSGRTFSVPSAPHAPPAAAPDRPSSWGLVWGGVAILLTVAALPFVGRFPFGVLGLDLLLAWGFLTLLRLRVRRADVAAGGPLVVALAPWLAVPFLVRLMAARQGLLLPLFLRFTILLEVAILGIAFGIYLLLRRQIPPGLDRRTPVTAIAAMGVALVAGLLLFLVVASSRLTSRGGALLGTTLLLVGAAVALQGTVGRWIGSQASKVLATGPALVVAAAQLLDGVVTYLAVRDPLGLAPGEFHEEVALSAWLLEYTGVGFPLVKWALAMIIAYTIDRPRPAHLQMAGAKRVGFYLLITYLGLGPGLYSSSRLF